MKKKIYTTLGLMSGTSMDGVDLSLIKSDGYNYLQRIYDKYYEFSDDLFRELTTLRENINTKNDLKKNSILIKKIEKKFTIFNAKIINELVEKKGFKPDLIGFHGQTIFHQAKDKISEQLGDGNLLSQLTKCIVVNKFRQQDLNEDGQGAPLTPIYHRLISKEINSDFNLKYPISILNIGGIANVTLILDDKNIETDIFAYDIAPGNCLIDELRNLK